jgi:hypothetical protein
VLNITPLYLTNQIAELLTTMEPGSQMGAPDFSVKMNTRINETDNVIHIWQDQLLSVIITDAYKMLLTNMNEIL